MQREFTAVVRVSEQLFVAVSDPNEVLGQALSKLREQLDGIYVGPQGGRYRFVGDLYGAWGERDPLTMTYTYRAKRKARYMRRDRE